MNTPRDVQTDRDTLQDGVAPVLPAISIPGKPLDPTLEASGMIPFDPAMWDRWELNATHSAKSDSLR